MQGAVWLDGLYDEADLIAVRIHHDNRFFAGVFVRVDVDVQVAVVSDCAQILVVSVLFSRMRRMRWTELQSILKIPLYITSL